MGRRSYLGGSTIVNGGSGWFSSPKKPSLEEQLMHELRYELSALEIERRKLTLANQVAAFVYDGGPAPDVDLLWVVESAHFITEFDGVRLREPEQKKAEFNAEQVRLEAKYKRRHQFSLWLIQDNLRRKVVAVCITGKKAKLMGFQPDADSFVTSAAKSGWFVGTFAELDALSDSELLGIWNAGHSPKRHPIWSKVR